MSASGLGLTILLLPAPRRSEHTSNFSPSSCALAKRNILHLFNWSSRDHFACLLPRPCSRQQPNTNVVPVLCVDVSDRTTFLVSAVAGLSATALICTGTRLAGLVSMITADRPRCSPDNRSRSHVFQFHCHLIVQSNDAMCHRKNV